jgi:hypothetical protein
MAVSRTITFPEDVIRMAEQLAAQEHTSVEEFVSDALREQFAGIQYLRRRGERATAERFRAALDQIPDAEPAPYDRLR